MPKKEKKGCRFSCCSCSCLLIVIVSVLICIFLIYAAFYWCWNIDNRIFEKLKTGEVDSNNCFEYFTNTITDYFSPQKDKNTDKLDNIDNFNINIDDTVENENIAKDYSEDESDNDSDFHEVNQLLKNNEIRKNLDTILKDKLKSKITNNSNEEITEDVNVHDNLDKIDSTSYKKKQDKYDYLSDLSEDKLLEKIGDDSEENKAILKIAIDKDFGIVLKQLIIKNSNISNELIENKSLLFYSAEKNSVKCRNYLINSGADLKTDFQGKNLLHVAAHKGDIALAKKCLSIGLPINKPTNIGYTPFYFSVMSGNLNMIKYLVENGAKVEKNLKYLAKSREIYDYLDSFE